MSEPVSLEVMGLVKRFGERVAVNGVDLRVEAGEVHGLIGPNGAGKTTLLRMLLGLTSPDAGSIRLLGGPAGTAAGPAVGGVAGFVETPHFYPYLSGRKNLRLLQRLDEAAAPKAERTVDAVLDEVGLGAQAATKVAAYSTGMRQRLGLAAALLRSPRVLLLDEPTSSLDPAGALDLRALVRRLTRGGAAVLLSSHNLIEVEDLCTRLTIIHRGRVVFAGSLDTLRRQAPDPEQRLRTSDDALALSLAREQPELRVESGPGAEGLTVTGAEGAVDRYVIALGRAGVAVRRLDRARSSLESVFLKMTNDSAENPASLVIPTPGRPAAELTGPVKARGVWAVVRSESAKLAAQPKGWAVLAACFLGPFLFEAAMKMQNGVPDDTLFGRWVKISGVAVPLFVLGFAAAWAFPALASVVGGDVFSAEDRYGTWPTILTRSRTPGEIFGGKVITAALFSVVAVCLLALSSVGTGLLAVGRQPLLGLSGTELLPSRALVLAAAAWASILPPVLAFTAVAVMLSVATRSSVAGVGLPVVIALVMELYSVVDGPYAVRRLLLTSSFVGWHGLLAEPAYYRPLLQGMATSAAYLVGCLLAAAVVLRYRGRRG